MNPNIVGRLVARAEDRPERAAIIEQDGPGGPRTVTFRELSARVARTAAGMRGAGVEAGDRILLFVPMSVDLYVALLATLHLGATAVFIDAWANRARLEAAVALARPRLLVARPAVHLLRLLSPSLRRIDRHWYAGRRVRRLDRYETLDMRPPVVVTDETPALITFTTGSTGRPKAAVRSHGLLWAQHLALAEHLRLRGDDIDMPTLPIFVLNNLALGVTTVLPAFDPRRPAAIDPASIVAQMRLHGVTTTSGSPAFYSRLAEWCRQRGERLDVRLWTGGAPVYPRLAAELDAVTGGKAHVVYGSTEAEPIAGIGAAELVRTSRVPDPVSESSERMHAWAVRGLCAGVPVPAVSVRIIRASDAPIRLGEAGWDELDLPAGETGEIVVTGDHVIGDYLHAPEETARHKIRDGDRVWHRTGDGGYLDASGRLWLMGRLSTRVKRNGETWWSTPAELRALSVDAVGHAAYLGYPDASGCEQAVLCVEADPTRASVERIRAALHPFPVDEIRFLPRIPRDPRHASKTDVDGLRRLLAS